MHLLTQTIKLIIQLKAHVIETVFVLKIFLQINYAYIKKIFDQTYQIMNHIIFINLNFVASATTILRRNIRNLNFAKSIAFFSKWIISRQSVFKKTVIKFETDIKNFQQRYFQSRTETFFSANNISLNRKFSFLAFKLASHFFENVYNKFIRDRSQFQFTSTNSLDLSSISEMKDRRNSSVFYKQIK